MNNHKTSKSKRKEEANQARKIAALKSTKFSRYLLIRYTLAGFFFANLYWLVAISLEWNWYGIVPIVMILASVLGIAEQLRMYGTDKVYLTWTTYFFRLAVVVQLGLLTLIHVPGQLTSLFPVFSDSIATKIFLSVIWLVGLLFAFANLRRIHLIGKNEDKAYQRIKQLEKFV